MTTATSASLSPPIHPPRWSEGRDGQLAGVVSRRIEELQRGLDESATARASLAQLRRAVARPPGSVPEAWGDTIGLLPDALLGRGDLPSRFEQAAHTAMTLYAVHQQGKSGRMHMPGERFGRVVYRLARERAVGDEPESKAVRRRFDAVVTAGTPAEIQHHLRGLVLLLRTEDLALDYGRLAYDLSRVASRATARATRLHWARDYRRLTTTDDNPAGTSLPDQPKE